MAARLYTVTLLSLPGRKRLEEATTQLDLDSQDSLAHLRRLMLRMAAVAAGRRVEKRYEDMPWLASYALEIREWRTNTYVLTYREA